MLHGFLVNYGLGESKFWTREIASDTRDYVIARPALGRYVANDGLVLFPYADYSHSSSIFWTREIACDHAGSLCNRATSSEIEGHPCQWKPCFIPLCKARYSHSSLLETRCMQVSDLDDLAFHSRIIFGNSPCHLQRIRCLHKSILQLPKTCLCFF